MRDIFILNEIWVQGQIYILTCILKYFTYCLVPTLAPPPDYTQHVLSPSKVRKMCCSLAELYVKCVFEFIWVEGGPRRSWNTVKWRGGGGQAVEFWEPVLQEMADYKMQKNEKQEPPPSGTVLTSLLWVSHVNSRTLHNCHHSHAFLSVYFSLCGNRSVMPISAGQYWQCWSMFQWVYVGYWHCRQ
jgi:hypothetical protein